MAIRRSNTCDRFLSWAKRAMVWSDVGDGKDSPGSDLIIASVDKDDPRPVWVGAGAERTILRKRFGKFEQLGQRKIYQSFLPSCACLTFLVRTTPAPGSRRTFLRCSTFVPPLFMGGNLQRMVIIRRNDIQSHGPLGAVYPDTQWATEGDTPAFMHVYPNGLNDP